MNKSVCAVAEQTELVFVALTAEQCETVGGGRWREDVLVVPPPPPAHGPGVGMNSAWGIYDPGGVGTPPGVYGECYESPTCHV